MGVVYFDQILGAALTQKLVDTLFLGRFQTFLFKISVSTDFRICASPKSW